MSRSRLRLWMLLALVAFAAITSAGAVWWRRTTVVAEYVVDANRDGVKDGIWRRYADGRVEVQPRQR